MTGWSCYHCPNKGEKAVYIGIGKAYVVIHMCHFHAAPWMLVAEAEDPQEMLVVVKERERS